MAVLDSVRCPADLRALDERELAPLAAELRERILTTAAHNGGHFASNLGAVELTVALHRVFDTPDPPSSQDEALSRYSASGEVPR